MTGAVAFAWQARVIAFRFIDGRTFKIFQPSLDPPRRHKQEYAIRPFNEAVLFAMRVELGDTPTNASVIAVNHHHQSL